MFTSLSWLDFLYPTTILVGTYYVVATILSGIKKLRRNATAHDLHSSTREEDAGNLMGAIKPSVVLLQQTSVDTNQVLIASEDNQDQQTEIIAAAGPTVADLLQEIKTLTQNILDKGSPAGESIPRYKALVQQNSHLADGPFKEAINKFIHDQCTNLCGFDIEISEIRSWWSNSN